MTKEEAIQFLDNMKHEKAGRAIGKDRFYAELMGYHVEALNMGIKALEQEPCSDAISRQAVNTLIDELARAISDERCCISRGRSTATIMRDILHLPPVTPKTGHWILQPSNKEQGEKDFIWWKCSECGQVIYSETEKDRREFHAFCGRCGAKMVEPQERSDKE